MREDLLKEVYQDLQETQRINEETESSRKNQIRTGYPAISALMDERESLIQGGIHSILQGAEAAEDLPARMESVSARIRKALKENGFPENYLAPVYTCPICRDTGFTGDKVREKCSCVRRRYQEKLRRSIGLPEDGSETFERFNPEIFPNIRKEGSRYSQREAMNLVRKNCESWVEAYPHQKQRDLILSGKSGLGKTFLLHAMAQRLIERDAGVLLLSAYSFLEIARKSYFEGDGRLDELIQTEVLMLDDLGSEPLMQNVTIEQLFNLINERQRRNLPTVISTNLNREELRVRYTERIASRIMDTHHCLFLPIEGEDIRRRRG